MVARASSTWWMVQIKKQLTVSGRHLKYWHAFTDAFEKVTIEN